MMEMKRRKIENRLKKMNEPNMNNMEGFDYDYLVIGGGSGGIASAKRAASHGAKVAGKLIIDKIIFFSHFKLNSFFSFICLVHYIF